MFSVQEAFDPRDDGVFFEEVVARIDVGQAEEFGPVQSGGEAFPLPAFGGVRKARLVQEAEGVFPARHAVGLRDEAEVPVQPPFRTDDGARSQGGDDVREVELLPEAGYQVADGVGRRAGAVGGRFGHGLRPFQRTAQKVVVHEGVDVRVEDSQNHHGFRAKGEAAEEIGRAHV